MRGPPPSPAAASPPADPAVPEDPPESTLAAPLRANPPEAGEDRGFDGFSPAHIMLFVVLISVAVAVGASGSRG